MPLRIITRQDAAKSQVSGHGAAEHRKNSGSWGSITKDQLLYRGKERESPECGPSGGGGKPREIRDPPPMPGTGCLLGSYPRLRGQTAPRALTSALTPTREVNKQNNKQVNEQNRTTNRALNAPGNRTCQSLPPSARLLTNPAVSRARGRVRSSSGCLRGWRCLAAVGATCSTARCTARGIR